MICVIVLFVLVEQRRLTGEIGVLLVKLLEDYLLRNLYFLWSN